jgi:hypothetical protein
MPLSQDRCLVAPVRDLTPNLEPLERIAGHDRMITRATSAGARLLRKA